MNVLNIIYSNDIILDIKKLIPNRTFELSIGTDNLDQIALEEYGEYDYWTSLGIYNNIINPFNLISQGINKIVLFSKEDLDSLLRLTARGKSNDRDI